jgi:hypothetical protein
VLESVLLIVLSTISRSFTGYLEKFNLFKDLLLVQVMCYVFLGIYNKGVRIFLVLVGSYTYVGDLISTKY